jgi:predicted HicB family RNase H-like nuclease
MADKETVYCQLATRIDKTLHQAVKMHCVKVDTSVMGFVAEALAEKLQRDKGKAAKK